MNSHHNGIYLPTHFDQWTFLRPICREDKPYLQAALAQLSARTRQWRFAAPVKHLSEAQWDQLLDVDQENHVAWGILALDASDLTASGVGRFVRDATNPQRAEIALTVNDLAQGQGLGTVLLALLLWLARHKRLAQLYGQVEADNRRVLSWVERLGATQSREAAGQVSVVFDLEKLQLSPGSHSAALLTRLETLNVGPPVDRVINHPHQTLLRRD